MTMKNGMNENDNPRISCIVPIYNVEKYLHRCIDSILAQTFTDFELILVDDGSPYNCGKICDEYAEKNSRVRVIHQTNNGVSAARNAGLDVAHGEYVCFVDGDDEVLEILFETVIKKIDEDKPEIVEFGFSAVRKCCSEEFLPGDIAQEAKVDCFGSWAKLYLRIFLLKNNIRYPEGVSLAEDWYFNYLIFAYAKRISLCDTVLYKYYQNVDSCMHTLSSKNIYDEILAVRLIESRPEIINQSLIRNRKIIAKRQMLFCLEKPDVELFRITFPEVNKDMILEAKFLARIYMRLALFLPQWLMSAIFLMYKKLAGKHEDIAF